MDKRGDSDKNVTLRIEIINYEPDMIKFIIKPAWQ